MESLSPFDTVMHTNFIPEGAYRHFSSDVFPTIHPVHWLTSHFAVGGWSPLQRISGMLTAHMTQIAPHNGFTWHPHRGLEIYTWVIEGRLHHEDTTGGEGDIEAGELQRMFSGNWIEHQELNPWDETARVIQIWYAADPKYRNLEPHYQQVGKADLPCRTVGEATVYSLIGDDSPMEQHMHGRLTATTIAGGGSTMVEAPRDGEDLFLYITDGRAILDYGEMGQYDVVLARPGAEISLQSETDFHYLSFYLPTFLD
jgi:redox-sensitive bicupin YhaK (pirin superfamily)